MDCCDHCQTFDPERGNPSYRRALWIVLAINAGMFLVEIGAGLAAGSASLQADALGVPGDAANYGISLLVVGMALRYRAMAAFAKGVSMGAFGLWVITTVVWHAVQGTLPSAVMMGAVGFAALAANAISFGILWFYRTGDADTRSAAVLLDAQRRPREFGGAARGSWRVRHGHGLAGYSGGRDDGGSRAARRVNCITAVSW